MKIEDSTFTLPLDDAAFSFLPAQLVHFALGVVMND